MVDTRHELVALIAQRLLDAGLLNGEDAPDVDTLFGDVHSLITQQLEGYVIIRTCRILD